MADSKGMDGPQQGAFDQFAGFQGNHFENTEYARDDEEADAVYAGVDEYMSTRRKRGRSAKEEAAAKRIRSASATVKEQFADVKQKLQHVTREEWNGMKEFSGRVEDTRRKELYAQKSAVPDYLIAGALKRQQSATSIGTETSLAGMASGVTTAGGVSQARKKMLSLQLDKVSDSVGGQTAVDRNGYLTSLSSMHVTPSSEIGDIKKARALFKSLVAQNPKHAPGWIAMARLEEAAGNLADARAAAVRGCEACPHSEDAWLESVRLQAADKRASARVVVAQAVQAVPRSVKLWLRAAELEESDANRRIVLRRALESVPGAVALWKRAVDLETVDGAREMLRRAVECVPACVDFWLALAKLETYTNAKRVLNRARAAVRADPVIWIAAAQLEEANGNMEAVDLIVQKAVRAMAAAQVVVGREAWLREATKAEEGGSMGTCGAIVRATVGQGIESQDRKSTWLDDAGVASLAGHVHTARAILEHALTVFPTKKSVWTALVRLEQSHGSTASVEKVLSRAVEHVPRAEELWLVAARHQWREQKDVGAARAVLQTAFRANEGSEAIWLEAALLEWEVGEVDRARALLQKAREQVPSARVWVKSALLEWEAGDRAAETGLLDEALRRFPTEPKLWLMRAQAEEEAGHIAEARVVYRSSLKACATAPVLWVQAARLEVKAGALSKARSLLEPARLKNPESDLLWAEAVEMERAYGDAAAAARLLAVGLQKHPTSGRLLALDIAMAPVPQQRRRGVHALKLCEKEPRVYCTLGHVFWVRGKAVGARKMLERAVKLDPDFGDAWAALYGLEVDLGTAENAETVIGACTKAKPKHGDVWARTVKQRGNRQRAVADVLKLVAAAVAPEGTAGREKLAALAEAVKREGGTVKTEET